MNNTPLTGSPGTRTYPGLNQPRLLESNSVMLGEDKTQMRRKKKQCRQPLWAKQLLASPWTQYQGMMETLNSTNHAASAGGYIVMVCMDKPYLTWTDLVEG